MKTGQVQTRAKQGVLVRDETGSDHWCRVPGKGKLLAMPAPGDRVRFQPSTGTRDGRVEEILPRETMLQRYAYGKRKTVAANMQQLLLMATPREPAVSPRLVDRMLVGASIGSMDEVVLVINKLDLFDEKEVERYIEPWRDLYPVVKVSAAERTGLNELERILRGQTSLLAGASGVGKSTLLNALISDLNLDTSAISKATGRGVHTTTATLLYPLPSGDVVADSPGVREFYPVLDNVDELPLHFPEFAPHRNECEFIDCAHLETSQGCAVVAAVERGEIHKDRYQSYLLLRESLLEGPKRGRQERYDPRPPM